jgi:cytoskeletal protein CcmA (bactofilin family)
MAKKTDVFQVSSMDTVIGSSVRLKGNVTSEGDVAIDGTLVGNIVSGGHVAIGVNARIGGKVEAVSVQVAGQIEGNVVAQDSVSLLETGQVRGDITTGRLEILLGAIFIGTSKMKAAVATEIADVHEGEAQA